MIYLKEKKLAVYRVHLVRHSDLCTGIDGGRYGGYQHDHRQSHFLYALGIYLYPCIHDPAGHQQCRSGLPTVMNASRSFGIGGIESHRFHYHCNINGRLVRLSGQRLRKFLFTDYGDYLGISIPVWVSSIIWGSHYAVDGSVGHRHDSLSEHGGSTAAAVWSAFMVSTMVWCRWMAPLSCLLMNRSRKCPFRRA